MKYLVIALASAALTGAQTPAISIRPNPAGSALVGTRTGVPILGYIAGPGSLELRPIVGTIKGAQLGPAVAVPLRQSASLCRRANTMCCWRVARMSRFLYGHPLKAA